MTQRVDRTALKRRCWGYKTPNIIGLRRLQVSPHNKAALSLLYPRPRSRGCSCDARRGETLGGVSFVPSSPLQYTFSCPNELEGG